MEGFRVQNCRLGLARKEGVSHTTRVVVGRWTAGAADLRPWTVMGAGAGGARPYEYVGVTAGGLERFLAAEVSERGGQVAWVRRGAVAFSLERGCARQLRTADRIVVALTDRDAEPQAVGRDKDVALETIEETARACTRANCKAALEIVRAWRCAERSGDDDVPADADVSFRVTCKRTVATHIGGAQRQKQAFCSVDAAGAFGAGVAEAAGWRVSLRAWHIDVFLLIEDDALAFAGLELLRTTTLKGRAMSVPLYALRPWRASLVETALKPSVARALLAEARVTAGDIVVDPCGGGMTIPLEAADVQAGPCQYACVGIGGDVDADPLVCAMANAEAAGRHAPAVGVLRWDGGALPLRSGIADAVVSDLPFGKRCGKPGQRGGLYSRVAREAARLLRPGGRAVFLCCGKKSFDVLEAGGRGFLKALARERITMELEATMCVFERVGGAYVGLAAEASCADGRNTNGAASNG